MEYDFSNIEIDTKSKKVFINGKNIDGVSNISFNWRGGEKAEVTMTLDAYVTLSGETLLIKDMCIINKKDLEKREI